MSERYSRLFSLQENLYSEGSPVVIAAGALLKDNETGKVLAQLKLRSICHKPIKAATVSILPYDVAGNPLGNIVEYQYLDIKAARDSEFGQKTPVILPNAIIRAYSVIVSEVIFDDNTIWHDDGHVWEPLPKQQMLAETFNDKELVKQYRLELGVKSEYVFQEEKDLWMCSCGSVNHYGEEVCHNCGTRFDALKSFDLNTLKANCELRLDEEKRQVEIAAAKAKAATKKAGKIAAVCAAVAVVIIAAVLLATKVIIPNGKYNNAVALMEAGQYEDAIAAFEALNGYKDSTAQIETCKTYILDNRYNEAVALMEAGQYEKAIAIFESLGGYMDSAELLQTAREVFKNEESYNTAISLLAAGNDDKAYEHFAALGDYKDAASYASKFISIPVRIESVGSFISSTLDLYYDDQGFLIEGKYIRTDGAKDSQTATYSYYPEGQLQKIVNFQAYGDPVKTTTTTYTYSADGTQGEQVTKNSRGAITRHYFTYTYDNQGKILTRICYDENKDKVYEEKYSYTFDKSGNILTKSIYKEWVSTNYEHIVSKYKYSENGELLSVNEDEYTCDYYTYEYLYVGDSEVTQSGRTKSLIRDYLE